jgi:hypothetical protein
VTIDDYIPKYELEGPQPRLRILGLWFDITPYQAEALRQAFAAEAAEAAAIRQEIAAEAAALCQEISDGLMAARKEPEA